MWDSQEGKQTEPKPKSENQSKPLFFPISEINQSNSWNYLINLSQNWMGLKPHWIPLPPPPGSGLEKLCDSAMLEDLVVLWLLLPYSPPGLYVTASLSASIRYLII